MENTEEKNKIEDWIMSKSQIISIYITIIGSVFMSTCWMNGKFNDIDKQFASVDKQFSNVEKDIAIIKTVLLMKDLYPKELVKHEGEK